MLAMNDKLREALAFYTDDANWRQNGPLDPNSAHFTGGPARAALAAAPQPTVSSIRNEISNLSVWSGKVHDEQQLVDLAHVLAILDAAPQPAPAPAADERDAMIEVIVQADDAYDRVQGGTWAGAIADALLAAGYRKADALLAERDALIHDIERAKESESALLTELEQARGIARQAATGHPHGQRSPLMSQHGMSSHGYHVTKSTPPAASTSC